MTAELKDTKTAKDVEQRSLNSKVVQEMERQLDELKESRKRQDEMLITVTGARYGIFQALFLRMCVCV